MAPVMASSTITPRPTASSSVWTAGKRSSPSSARTWRSDQRSGLGIRPRILDAAVEPSVAASGSDPRVEDRYGRQKGGPHMCTYSIESAEMTGCGKGAEGWFPLSLATVAFDHPSHAQVDHAMLIDFMNPDL